MQASRVRVWAGADAAKVADRFLGFAEKAEVKGISLSCWEIAGKRGQNRQLLTCKGRRVCEVRELPVAPAVPSDGRSVSACNCRIAWHGLFANA